MKKSLKEMWDKIKILVIFMTIVNITIGIVGGIHTNDFDMAFKAIVNSIIMKVLMVEQYRMAEL